MKAYPSIFNDVIGPVMRGPSSSHCAAALRIGRMARDLMNAEINEAEISYGTEGSLVTTHRSQGSDMGLYSGFLGFDADSEELLRYEENIAKAGIAINVSYKPFGMVHPNTYKINLRNGSFNCSITALSTGGGMVEITGIEDAEVSIKGDYYETIIFIAKEDIDLISQLAGLLNPDYLFVRKGNRIFINIKTVRPVEDEEIELIKKNSNVNYIARINPVLPVRARKGIELPFTSCAGMEKYNTGKNLALWQLALEYESARGGITAKDVLGEMRRIVRIMEQSVQTGLKGTEYGDRLLPSQSPNFKKLMEEKKLLGDGLQNLITLYTSAIMEVKSSMGIIVAAPTAGSCGSIAGPVIAASHFLNRPEDETVKAMLAAGLIGIFILNKSTFAAEEAGCQAECGSGAGMAAAALAYLAGGSLEQSLAASSLALQNSFGMTCDPIAGRVEAPCLGKNVMAAVNALACANMAIAGYKHLIPLDEVIEAFDSAGRSLPRELRCTALGGLSVTDSSKKIEKELE